MTVFVIAVLAAGALVLGLRLAGVLCALRSLSTQLPLAGELTSNQRIRIPPSPRAVRELTERLNDLLSELRRQKLSFEDGDRNLSDSLTMWAHDLRTPLAAISGYTDLLRRESQTENGARYVAAIRQRASVMEQITEELFSFALLRGGNAACAQVDLLAALERAAGAFYDAFTERGLEPEIDTAPGPVIVTGDPLAVERILYNLFSNTLRYAGSCARICLDADGTLRFENDAQGMDPLEVQSLLGKMTTVPRLTRASGVGLAVVRELTENMGGTFSGGCENGMLAIAVHLPGLEVCSP